MSFVKQGFEICNNNFVKLTALRLFAPFTLVPLPKGGLMAVDSEAVLVAHAESVLTDVGSRLTRADGRYALARLSLFDCRSSCIFVDDYVMPKEKVVDYLTRFSGILPEDLDSSNSIHNIVTMRVAYLKLRVLMQRYEFYSLSRLKTRNIFFPNILFH